MTLEEDLKEQEVQDLEHLILARSSFSKKEQERLIKKLRSLSILRN